MSLIRTNKQGIHLFSSEIRIAFFQLGKMEQKLTSPYLLSKNVFALLIKARITLHLEAANSPL